jgi:hypothetical protein
MVRSSPWRRGGGNGVETTRWMYVDGVNVDEVGGDEVDGSEVDDHEVDDDEVEGGDVGSDKVGNDKVDEGVVKIKIVYFERFDVKLVKTELLDSKCCDGKEEGEREETIQERGKGSPYIVETERGTWLGGICSVMRLLKTQQDS